MNLIRTSLLSSIAVAIKLLTLLFINKILAVYVGPSGYAALGQFQNAIQMITAFASSAINTGVTKYTAEYQNDEIKQRKIWKTAGTITLVGSLATSLMIAWYHETLALWFLDDKHYGSIFLWFAATLIFFTFNSLLLAVLNGKKEIKIFVLASIAGSVFALVITSIMATQLGLYGALIALAIYQSISFISTILLCRTTFWFKPSYFFGSIDKKIALKLGHYAGMALTSAACVPLSHIFIRNHIGETLGWTSAGNWEAVMRLSGAYLMLVTTTLSVYYLPRLSELITTKDIKHEIYSGYKLVLPFAAVAGFGIYLFRDPLIFALFTREFAQARDLIAWQMLGDTLKIGSWILAYLMLSKAMTGLFIASEISFAILFYTLAHTMTNAFGLEGVAAAYATSYGIYWAILGLALNSKLKQINQP